MDAQIRILEPFVIGLTGNIGTGKTTVLNMLRHLGAYGIDADALTKKVYDLPAAQNAIISALGADITDKNGGIDRARVAEIVFKDPQALRTLENIIHPLVSIAAEHLINSSRLPIIVIEAIKLLESDLVNYCDSIWVVDADVDTITRRLAKHRGMTITQVQNRLAHQSPAHKIIAHADVVITNNDNLRTTWQHINQNWQALREENTKFSKASDRSKSLLRESGSYILSPFADKVNDLSTLLLDKNKITPSGETLTASALDLLSTNSAIFTPPDTADDGWYSIWELHTFHMSCQGIFCTVAQTTNPQPSFPLSKIENLAHLHQAAEIIFPIQRILKEESSILQEKGYTLDEQNKDDHTQWIKAGYNLFTKRLWDPAVIFEIEKSP